MSPNDAKKTRERMKLVTREMRDTISANIAEIVELHASLTIAIRAAVESGAYHDDDLLVEAGGMGETASQDLKSWLRRTTAAFKDRATPKSRQAMNAFLTKKKPATAAKGAKK